MLYRTKCSIRQPSPISFFSITFNEVCIMSQCVLACSLTTRFKLPIVYRIASISFFLCQLMMCEVGVSIFRKPLLLLYGHFCSLLWNNLNIFHLWKTYYINQCSELRCPSPKLGTSTDSIFLFFTGCPLTMLLFREMHTLINPALHSTRVLDEKCKCVWEGSGRRRAEEKSRSRSKKRQSLRALQMKARCWQ